ncbi:MAG: hypothetical protein ACOY0T_18990 [Myxococcota bacterium]
MSYRVEALWAPAREHRAYRFFHDAPGRSIRSCATWCSSYEIARYNPSVLSGLLAPPMRPEITESSAASPALYNTNGTPAHRPAL